jgi:hypothetical protein
MADQLAFRTDLVEDMFEEGISHLEDSFETLFDITEDELEAEFTDLVYCTLAPLFTKVAFKFNTPAIFGVDSSGVEALRQDAVVVIKELELLSPAVCNKGSFLSFATVVERSLIESTLLGAWKLVSMSSGMPSEKQREIFATAEKTLGLLKGESEETRARCFIYSVVGVLTDLLVLEGEEIVAADTTGKELLAQIQTHARKTKKKAAKRKL